MKYIIITILNLIDYALTTYWTSIYGIQTEINPIMRGALSEPWVFAVVKLVLFPFLLLWMWYKKYNDAAWVALGMFITLTWMNICVVFGL